MNIYEKAKTLKSWCVKHRRHLHQFPELSWEEKETSAYCQQILKTLNYKITPMCGYGFIADLVINEKFKTIAFRTDMDALPMEEKSQHDYVSQNPGVGHMCGHDVHMTIALATAKLLKEFQSNLTCNIRFVFQPAEELLPGGAIKMIEAGCLKDVDQIYGLHTYSQAPVGQVITRPGPFLAAGDMFELNIQGKGCHGAQPHNGLDSIYLGSSLVMQWQSIVSRKIQAVHPAVLSVTQFHAGSGKNIIPDSAQLAGTIRTFHESDRVLIESLMRNSLLSYEKEGFKFQFDYQRGYDAVINDCRSVEQLIQSAGEIVGKEKVYGNSDVIMGSEDFSYYLQQCSGAFYFLGTGNPGKNICQPLHSPYYDVDEDCLSIGAAIMANLATNMSDSRQEND